MENVLDVYCQPYDPLVPRICMDEMGKNLVKDKYLPEPAKPGQVARKDYTDEKKGSENLFIAYEPLAGKRYLKVTEHRTKLEMCSTLDRRARSITTSRKELTPNLTP